MSFIKAGVIGHPIAHSLSPVIHNHWIETLGLQGSYKAIDIAPDRLRDDVMRLFDDEGYSGLNVTLPHKQAIQPLCDELDAAAQAVGAVNTLMRTGNKIIGSNTDATGYITNLQKSAPDFQCEGRRALVLGAGGAARAIVYGLQQLGVTDIIITNRTYEKAQEIAADFSIEAAPWDNRAACGAGASLVVNTTALGMKGKDDLDFDVRVLPDDALVSDIVYNPRRTTLLANAAARGLRTVEGLGMLLYQAQPAFARWFGVEPVVDDVLEAKLYAVLKGRG